MKMNNYIVFTIFIWCFNNMKINSQEIPNFESKIVRDINGKIYKEITYIDNLNQFIKYFDESGNQLFNYNLKHIDEIELSNCLSEEISHNIKFKECWYKYIYFSFSYNDNEINSIRVISHNFNQISNPEVTKLIKDSLGTIEGAQIYDNNSIIEFYFVSYTMCSIERGIKKL